MSSSDRFPYLTATVLDQSLLDNSHDNLTCQLELIVDIERPDTGFIRASDRNKYVGSIFYEALLKFPIISRTVGDWLVNTLEFSDLILRISNVDGRFNEILPSGVSYDGWIGRDITVQLGLRDVAATYTTIFGGEVTPVGGFGRDVESITLQARDDFDKVNKQLPTTVFTSSVFPDISDSLIGSGIPVIYGDWTQTLTEAADVLAFIVNTEDDDMNGNTSRTNNVEVVISQTTNKTFDTTKVYLNREIKKADGSVTNFHLISSSDITAVAANKNQFEIIQDSGNTTITDADGVPQNFVYESGDLIFVQVVGVDLGAYDDNIVWQARNILITYGGAASFNANWATFRDKASPAQSAISTIKSRIWQQDAIPAMELALSLLEQVRLEIFVDREREFKINSLHFEDYVSSPTFRVTNFDVQKGSFKPRIDVRTNFNRAKGLFNRLPGTGENENETSVFKNTAAITQAGKDISKRLVFPNLYIRTDVNNQVTEIIRLASSYLETIELTNTWRTMLKDVGDFLKLNVQIESAVYSDVPCMIRSIGYDPDGLKIPLKIWSFQMTPFPGYEPGFAGTVGGYNATITEE